MRLRAGRPGAYHDNDRYPVGNGTTNQAMGEGRMLDPALDEPPARRPRLLRAVTVATALYWVGAAAVTGPLLHQPKTVFWGAVLLAGASLFADIWITEGNPR
jgi:hypothetical protein